MNSKNELLDNYSIPNEDQFIPKMEPIDIDFIKKEEIDEECYVEPGVTVSLKVNKISVKNEESESCSSPTVRTILYMNCNFDLFNIMIIIIDLTIFKCLILFFLKC